MRSRLGWLWAAPAGLLIAAVTIAPLLLSAWASLHRRLPVFGIDEWAGLSQYGHLAVNPRFLASLKTTLYFTGVSVALELVAGLAIALLLRREFRGGSWVLGLSLLPWIVPTPVAAKMWEWALHPDFGIVNHLLMTAGLLDAPVPWLGTPILAIHAAIVAEAWKTTPFMALLLLAGLRAVPQDLYRAAAVDGAGPARTFLHVTLPQLAPMMTVAVLFRALDAVRVFDVLYVLTGGGPANATESLSIYAYKVLFQRLEFGYGAALGMALFFLACLLAVAALPLADRREAAR
ncbi:MAG: sugar ABC transporter permease [Elusimicrobia bacterium]|nr:sugar ABC transporter permease [Elusimicrobiota bacterium]